ncbi:MAG: cytochrome c [Gammaproteobacteria bacterium]|nr:cytochrome c [Gammaproteobacteria bacterium]
MSDRLRTLAAGAAAFIGLAGCDSTSGQAVSGERLYANHCAACHGQFGEGDGPVADVMRVSMPNLRTLSMRNDGVYPAEDVRAYVDGRELPAAHGDRYMPIWGVVFGWGSEGGAEMEADIEQRVAALVEYLEQIQYR